jgi:dihydroorotate dehydrogenase electron transfer subunit
MIPADGWISQLAEPVRWADQLCAALPNQDYNPLAHHIRTLRFQLDDTFAHVLVTTDIVCGVGACLACVVATRDGSYTRACIHGPVFPLATIAQ